MSRQSGFRRGAPAFLFLVMAATAAAASGPLAPDRIVPGPSLLPVPAPDALPALKGLLKYHRADIDPQSLRRRLEGFQGGPFKLDLGGNYGWDLELEPSGIRSSGYKVRHLTDKGVVTVAPTPDRSYRGRVRGKPGSRVRIAFQDGRINGFVDPGEGDKYFVEPLDHMLREAAPQAAGPVPHVVYRERDVLPESGAACGLDAPGHGALPLPPARSPGAPALPGIRVFPGSSVDGNAIAVPPSLAKPGAGGAEACALVELAVAVEYSMVKGLGTAAAAEKRINDIYNMVDGLYQDPQVNIRVRISEIFIETVDKATWGASLDINKYLNVLTSWMSGPDGFENAFDVGSLWYYHLGGGTVGLAWVGVVCNNNRSNVIRYFTATSRSMMIDAAHELGHNFSAPHISNPSWIMNPSITGSNDQWDASTVAKVVAHKKSRACMSACDVSPIADFTVAGATACAETRAFTDLSAGDPTAWLWEFGDGLSSDLRNPSHTYAAAGRYSVKLSASNAFGANAVVKGNIRVKEMPAPTAKDADGCAPATLTLAAQGTGTLRWYDTASGGGPLATGPQFTTPVLTKARTYYVEDGEPDPPISKVGPLATSIGPGQLFTSNGDRRLFFDVHRPAVLVSAKVSSGAAGPRLVEILDAKDRRLLARTVQVPAGESRVALGFTLQPGVDYAIKVVGTGDSVNLFRNSSGADYPYISPDTLVTITGSDATGPDSITQSGYYYYFYDWEVRETGCASPRVPVQAKLTCTSDLADLADLAAAGAFRAALRPLSPGRYLLEGAAPKSAFLEVSIRSLDGALIRRLGRSVAAGPLSIPISLGSGSQLLTADIRLGDYRARTLLPRF